MISDYLNNIRKTVYDPYIKEALLEYMTKREYVYGASSAKITDFVTGEKVYNKCRIIYQDEEFEWRPEEVYLLEKYDLKVSDEFIHHVMGKNKG